MWTLDVNYLAVVVAAIVPMDMFCDSAQAHGRMSLLSGWNCEH